MSSIVDVLKESQENAVRYDNLKNDKFGKYVIFHKNSCGLKIFQCEIWVPLFGDRRKILLDEPINKGIQCILEALRCTYI